MSRDFLRWLIFGGIVLTALVSSAMFYATPETGREPTEGQALAILALSAITALTAGGIWLWVSG